jgi:hypothetical protein
LTTIPKSTERSITRSRTLLEASFVTLSSIVPCASKKSRKNSGRK